jgi:serine/threonine-protein kinase
MFDPGRLIAGKYRIERTLGEGGMGVVVLAKHLQLDQSVALKFMHTKTGLPPEAVTRFLREARAVAKLRGEHVARVLDVDTLADGTPYIVMEYLEGRDLATRLDEGPVPPMEAVDYVIQTCVGLAEAHAQGIVHRDLKPANLFLTRTPDGTPLVKVLDFGVSKLRADEDGQTSTTRTGTVMGSPLFMPPEQARSSKDVDGRADIWSLGAVLYKLITQRPPFLADNMADLFAEILHRPHVPITEHAPDVSPGLAAVIDRCLAKLPSDRYATLGDLALALGPFASADGQHLVPRVLRLSGDARASDPNAHRFSDPELKIATVADGPSPVLAASGGSTEAPLSVTQDKKPARTLWLVGAAIAAVATVAMAFVFVAPGLRPAPEPDLGTPGETASAPLPAAPVASTGVTPATEPAAEPAPSAAAAPPAPDAGAIAKSRTEPIVRRPAPAPAAAPAPSAPAPKPSPKPGDDPFGTMQ